MDYKFELLERKYAGTIELNDKVQVSDPCYNVNTWCAGTLGNVLQGKYHCFYQKADTGDWGVRVASIEVRHENYLDIEPDIKQNIDVCVDSGQAGIYDYDYFAKNREDKNGEDAWYWKICDLTSRHIKNPDYIPFNKSSHWKDEFGRLEERFGFFDNIESLTKILGAYYNKRNELVGNEYETVKDDTLNQEYCKAKEKYLKSENKEKYIYDNTPQAVDSKCLVSCSGDGDGDYTCLVGKNDDDKIVSIKIDYYYGYDPDDDGYED